MGMESTHDPGASNIAPQPVAVLDRRGKICREVLETVPEWFGIPAATARYVSAAEELPMLACFDPAGAVAGFVSVKAQTTVAAEIHVLAVKRAWHRRGIGRALIEGAGKLAAAQGAQFLTVKTLLPSKVDLNYAATRQFYEVMGFLPIEEFPTLWGADNPCLLMLRPLLDVA
jgi:ribosomal protein S18 acetylase RimI-like enzyme